MQSGKQTWKHQSPSPGASSRVAPDRGRSHCCSLQSRGFFSIVWQRAIIQTDEDRLIDLKISSFFCFLFFLIFDERKECRKGPRMTSGGSSAERPGSS
ncbi:hypothetical protein JOB18_020241 [Solea senegalensis]|uniref:Uncharacterized protein n=1 Tax=Solea senegalensis TaxID=28829 RepID=A0AAV6QPK1_SOLSE|nr:hypothetical protein JOB18_020241 [Solea senegalensis]